MKSRAHELLQKFKKASSPFLYAQLILELGPELLDRITPDATDLGLEDELRAAIQRLEGASAQRREKLAAALGERR